MNYHLRVGDDRRDDPQNSPRCVGGNRSFGLRLLWISVVQGTVWKLRFSVRNISIRVVCYRIDPEIRLPEGLIPKDLRISFEKARSYVPD